MKASERWAKQSHNVKINSSAYAEKGDEKVRLVYVGSSEGVSQSFFFVAEMNLAEARQLVESLNKAIEGSD